MFQGMRYVYEVYCERSFSRAAQKLYISQPSLSAAVKRVEDQIGSPIFDRSTTPVSLTELGRAYIRTAESIMEAENSFRQYLNDVNTLKRGTVSIGGTNLFASYVLPPLLSQFAGGCPLIHVNVLEANTMELSEKLLAGTLDLLIDNREMDPVIYGREPFCQEHLLLAVPKRFAAAAGLSGRGMTAEEIKAGQHLRKEASIVSPAAFAMFPFLLLKPGNDTRTRANRICRNARFSPRICLELDQQITAYNLSCYGMGVSFLGDVLISHVPSGTELLYYRLEDPCAVRTISFFYKRNRCLPAAAREFLRILQQREQPLPHD